MFERLINFFFSNKKVQVVDFSKLDDLSIDIPLQTAVNGGNIEVCFQKTVSVRIPPKFYKNEQKIRIKKEDFLQSHLLITLNVK